MKNTALLLVACALFASCFVLSPQNAAAQSSTRVRFARGSKTATVRGAVKGYAYRDYVFSARAGQRATISLESKYPHPQMFVRDPNGENLSTGAGSWNGALPANGTYAVRVLLPRAFARRGQSSSYVLTIEIE
jgi:hypothetical protein